jgi:hypothetical protein
LRRLFAKIRVGECYRDFANHGRVPEVIWILTSGEA